MTPEARMEIRRFIASAVPANDDVASCACNVQAVSGERLQQLLMGLEAAKASERTFERPAPQRIRLHPAPWLRRQMAVEGRAGA